MRNFLADAERSIEALDPATSGFRPKPSACTSAGSTTRDRTRTTLRSKLIGLLAKARPQALLFEGANPRHEHEWEDWKAARIPDDKVLVPGVINSTNNFVEHPVLVAQRICRFADIVGRERVLAGTDCGFAQGPFYRRVHPSIMWAKLEALAAGARLASKELWSR